MQLHSLMRTADGLLPNSLAILYALCGHVIGLVLLTQGGGPGLLVGVMLTMHSMVIAAYLIHDAVHMNLLRDERHSRWLAEIMAWLCGAAYVSYARIRLYHIRHHRDRADVTRFNYKQVLLKLPKTVRQLVYVLEWLYIPAIELMMHYQLLLRPFINPSEHDRRLRIVIVGISRLALFGLLYWLSPLALLLYALAYLLFLTVLNFADAFHHTFDQYFVDDDRQRVSMDGKDREYEQRHTYSNLVSTRWSWLNLLTLNFGYHNAHHERMSVPWYQLPQLHQQLFADDHRQTLPFRELLRSFHRNRLRRILDEDYGQVEEGQGRADGFVGAHGVSFLTVM